MHRALSKLLWLRSHASARRILRGMRSPRRAFMTLFTFALMAFYFVSILFAFLTESPEFAIDSEIVRAWLPVGLMIFFLVSLVSPATQSPLAFLPAEINFLFPGPFTRRELVLYRLAGTCGLIGAISLVASLTAQHYGATFLGAFLGAYFYLLAGFLASIIISLLKQRIALRYRRWTQASLWVLLLVSSALVLRYILLSEVLDDPLEAAKRLHESPAYSIALAPFRLIAGIILTQTADAALLLRTTLAASVNVVGLLLVLNLDSGFLEASLAQSKKREMRLKQIKSGKFFSAARAKSAKVRVPQLPRWKGIGPIARRQLLAALRGRLIRPLFSFSLAGGILLGYGIRILAGPDVSGVLKWAPLGIMLYVTLILTTHLRYDFRSEIDCLDRLKTLPLASLSISIGELFVPTVVVTLSQLIFYAAFALGIGSIPFNPLLGFMLFSLNGLVLSVENSFFLVFPSRNAMPQITDPSEFGRMMFVTLVKGAVLLLMCAFAAGSGTLVYFLSGSVPAALLAGWIVLTLCMAAFVMLVAQAFKQLDPSVDFG